MRRSSAENANVNSFDEVDQTFNWVSAQAVPPTGSHAVSDEDLGDAEFPGECNQRLCGISVSFHNLDRGAGLASYRQVAFEGRLV
jgi:hypothetical protein